MTTNEDEAIGRREKRERREREKKTRKGDGKGRRGLFFFPLLARFFSSFGALFFFSVSYRLCYTSRLSYAIDYKCPLVGVKKGETGGGLRGSARNLSVKERRGREKKRDVTTVTHTRVIKNDRDKREKEEKKGSEGRGKREAGVVGVSTTEQPGFCFAYQRKPTFVSSLFLVSICRRLFSFSVFLVSVCIRLFSFSVFRVSVCRIAIPSLPYLPLIS
jgi:hypothetical protein